MSELTTAPLNGLELPPGLERPSRDILGLTETLYSAARVPLDAQCGLALLDMALSRAGDGADRASKERVASELLTSLNGHGALLSAIGLQSAVSSLGGPSFRALHELKDRLAEMSSVPNRFRELLEIKDDLRVLPGVDASSAHLVSASYQGRQGDAQEAALVLQLTSLDRIRLAEFDDSGVEGERFALTGAAGATKPFDFVSVSQQLDLDTNLNFGQVRPPVIGKSVLADPQVSDMIDFILDENRRHAPSLLLYPGTAVMELSLEPASGGFRTRLRSDPMSLESLISSGPSSRPVAGIQFGM